MSSAFFAFARRGKSERSSSASCLRNWRSKNAQTSRSTATFFSLTARERSSRHSSSLRWQRKRRAKGSFRSRLASSLLLTSPLQLHLRQDRRGLFEAALERRSLHQAVHVCDDVLVLVERVNHARIRERRRGRAVRHREVL